MTAAGATSCRQEREIQVVAHTQLWVIDGHFMTVELDGCCIEAASKKIEGEVHRIITMRAVEVWPKEKSGRGPTRQYQSRLCLTSSVLGLTCTICSATRQLS